VSNAEDRQNIYENIGQDRGSVEDDGWGSSEFEEYEEDQRSVGAHSQNSQEGGERSVSKTRNLFRRVPGRLSRGKPGVDVQSMVSWN